MEKLDLADNWPGPDGSYVVKDLDFADNLDLADLCPAAEKSAKSRFKMYYIPMQFTVEYW